MSNNQPQPQKSAPQPKTNELGSFKLSGFIKITDPKTGQVLLQKRCE